MYMILLPNFQTEFQTGNVLMPLVLGTLTTAPPVATFKYEVLILMTLTRDSIAPSSMMKEKQN